MESSKGISKALDKSSEQNHSDASEATYHKSLCDMSFFENNVSAKYEKLAYDFQFKDLDGSILNISEYKNKVIVVVNVAMAMKWMSKCIGGSSLLLAVWCVWCMLCVLVWVVHACNAHQVLCIRLRHTSC